jgi:hypothetical protein
MKEIENVNSAVYSACRTRKRAFGYNLIATRGEEKFYRVWLFRSREARVATCNNNNNNIMNLSLCTWYKLIKDK